MALISLRQLLDHGAEKGYAVPAFNINNMEQGLAILNAAKKCDAPVILQASRGARSYAGDIMLSHMVQALTKMYPEIHEDNNDFETIYENKISLKKNSKIDKNKILSSVFTA